MITTRELIARLSQLDPNLPVLLRLDGFTWKDGLHDIRGVPVEYLDHSDLLSDRAQLDAADVAEIWNHDDSGASVEISVRVVCNFSFCHCRQEHQELQLLARDVWAESRKTNTLHVGGRLSRDSA